MIDLTALKEQLKILGHNLPDDQVIAILKEMNIDFDTDAGDIAGPNAGGSSSGSASHARKTGSILDNVDWRAPGPTHLQQGHSSNSHQQPSPPFTSHAYGYTEPAQGAALGAGVSSQPGTSHHRPAGTAPHSQHHHAGSPYEDDSDDDTHDHHHEPGVSCKHCAAEASGPSIAPARNDNPSGTSSSTSSRPRYDSSSTTILQSSTGIARLRVPQAWSELRSQGGDLAGAGHGGSAAAGAGGAGGSPGAGEWGAAQLEEERSLCRLLDRMELEHGLGGRGQQQQQQQQQPQQPATAGGQRAGLGLPPRPGTGAGGMARPASAGPAAAAAAAGGGGRDQRPKSAAPLKSAMRQTTGVFDYDADDVALPADKQPSARSTGAVGAAAAQRRPGTATGLGPGAAKEGGWTGARGPAASTSSYEPWCDGMGGPAAARYSPLSPQASSRSCASRMSTGSNAAGKAKKVDRVARYQKLQQEWTKNSFLAKAGGTSRGTTRKPINFHAHFASLHAAEAAERSRMLKETRAKTKQVLGTAVDAPTANRRDELRWQMRMRLKEQL